MFFERLSALLFISRASQGKIIVPGVVSKVDQQVVAG